MLKWVLLCLLLFPARAAWADADAGLAISCLPDSARMTLAQVRALPDGVWQPRNARAPFVTLASADWCRLRVHSRDALGAVVRFKTPSVMTAPVAVLHWPDAAPGDAGTRLGVEAPSFGRSHDPAVLVERRHLGRAIHLRFPTRAGPRGSLEPFSVPGFLAQASTEESFQMAVLASMAVLGLMALLFAYPLGRRILVSLGTWIVAVTLLRTMESGLFTSWLPMAEDARRLLHALALTLTVAASIIFSSRYLGIGTHFPRVSRVLMWATALLAALGLAVALGIGADADVSKSLRDAYNLLLIVQFVAVASCALRLFVRRDAMAQFFILGWSPVLVVSVVRAAGFTLDIPMPDWLEWLWQLLLLFAVFMLLLATAHAGRDVGRELDAVRRAASHDSLTGLPNRAYLFDALRQGIDKARANGWPLALLFLDLDHFKRVNDLYGHDVGDRCLRHVAVVLQARLRSGDTLARLGGEEFVVLLPDAGVEQAGKVSEDLRQALAKKPFMLQHGAHLLTLSAGVAVLRAYDDAETLLKRADAAAYRAKADGRNRTVLETALALR